MVGAIIYIYIHIQVYVHIEERERERDRESEREGEREREREREALAFGARFLRHIMVCLHRDMVGRAQFRLVRTSGTCWM